MLSPFLALIIWLLLIYLRSKNATTTFFDITVVMLSIGLYALFQITFYYFKGGSLAETLASKVIESFIALDPTNQIKAYLEKVSQMTDDTYAAKISAIDQENANYTWKTLTGSLLYMLTALGLAAISLLYHIFGEKRETISRLAEVAITVSLLLIFVVEIYLYFCVYAKFVFVHNTEVVKLSLAELKKSMSSNLVAFWNDDKNQDMRDQLRQKAEMSDGVSLLVRRLQTLIDETAAISSVHGNWSRDMVADVETRLNELERSLKDTMSELNQLIEDPSKPGAILSNQSGQMKLTTLNALSASVTNVASLTTGTADVDIIIESVSQECQSLITDLDTFSKTDLFGSYRNTRDILVELSKQCTIDDSDGDLSDETGLLKRLSCNLNTVVIVGSALFLVCLAWNKLMLQNNYRIDFCFAIITCLGLLIFQPYFIDYAHGYKTTASDFQMTLFSALHSSALSFV